VCRRRLGSVDVDGHAVALQDGAVVAVDEQVEVECGPRGESRAAALELDCSGRRMWSIHRRPSRSTRSTGTGRSPRRRTTRPHRTRHPRRRPRQRRPRHHRRTMARRPPCRPSHRRPTPADHRRRRPHRPRRSPRQAQRVVEPVPSVDAAETGVADIRDQASREPKRTPRTEHDWTRVPTPNETADSITRARRALAELEARSVHDERRAKEDARVRQLAEWHHRDRAADTRTNERDLDLGRAL
jgi:hypothetical protein